MKKIIARLKTAEEITGIKGCHAFFGDGWTYIQDMDKLAQTKQFIELQIADDNDTYGKYDYRIKDTLFWVKKEWLKDIREEEIDWEKVPVDTKLLVNTPFVKGQKRYFSHFEDGQNPKVYYFREGATSWSARKTWSCNPEFVKLWEGED